MRHLFLAAPALLFALTLGCGDRKRAQSETGGVSDTATPVVTTPDVADASAEVRDFGFEDRQAFAESVRQQLAGIDAEIEDLAAQAKSQGGAVSDRALSRIRDARQAVDRNLSQLEAATAANWDQVENGVNQSVASLEEQIEMAQPK